MSCRQLCLWIGLISKTNHINRNARGREDQYTTDYSNKKHLRHTLFIFVEPASERLETSQSSQVRRSVTTPTTSSLAPIYTLVSVNSKSEHIIKYGAISYNVMKHEICYMLEATVQIRCVYDPSHVAPVTCMISHTWHLGVSP